MKSAIIISFAFAAIASATANFMDNSAFPTQIINSEIMPNLGNINLNGYIPSLPSNFMNQAAAPFPNIQSQQETSTFMNQGAPFPNILNPQEASTYMNQGAPFPNIQSQQEARNFMSQGAPFPNIQSHQEASTFMNQGGPFPNILNPQEASTYMNQGAPFPNIQSQQEASNLMNQGAAYPYFPSPQEVANFLNVNNGQLDAAYFSNMLPFPANQNFDFSVIPENDEEVAEFLRFGRVVSRARQQANIRNRNNIRNQDCGPSGYDYGYGYALPPSSGLAVASPSQLTPPPPGSAEDRAARARRPAPTNGRRRN